MARPRSDESPRSISVSRFVRDIERLMGDDITTREQIILVAIDQMVDVGPVDFNANTVCEKLGIKHPMINYYFGSRDALIADAAIWAFRGWSKGYSRSISGAKTDPEARLRASIGYSNEWSHEMGAVSVLVQYPMLSSSVRTILVSKYGDEMVRVFEFHLALLTQIVIDMRKGTRTTIEFDETNYPRNDRIARHPAEFMAATSIALASHGLSMWSSGQHHPSQKSAKEIVAGFTRNLMVENHISEIIRIAKGRG